MGTLCHNLETNKYLTKKHIKHLSNLKTTFIEKHVYFQLLIASLALVFLLDFCLITKDTTLATFFMRRYTRTIIKKRINQNNKDKILKL